MCLSLEFDCHDQNNLVISPDRERVCEVRAKLWMESGRAEGEGNFVILNLKANSCYYWPVLFFCVLRGVLSF